jgi:hypothetical protein
LEGHSLHGIVPYCTLFIDDTSSHCASASQCKFIEHLSTSDRAVPHVHLRRLLWHPYWFVIAKAGVGHVPHVMRFPSPHSMADVQHVLVLVHAKSEFCPIDGVASAQHCVASMDVVPAEGLAAV